MKVNLTFVPPDGGEQNYFLLMELPQIPSKGDYLSIMRSGKNRSENFIVKRTWWNLQFDESKKLGQVSEIWVECEFALSPFSSESHKQACINYEQKTGILLEFDESPY